METTSRLLNAIRLLSGFVGRVCEPLLNAIRFLSGFVGRVCELLLNAIMNYSSRLLSICALYYRLLLSSFSTLEGFRLLLHDFLRQFSLATFHGIHVLIFASLMLGFLVIVHATQQLSAFGGEDYVGWLLVTIVVREVGPVWAAFFVLLHSGSAITVELGTMSVSREVESLKMVGIDPYRFLGVPRFWGVTLSLLVLYILAMFAAILGGYIFAQIFTEVFWAQFWSSFINALEWRDVAVGFAKVTSFGTLIATVAIFFGFRAEKDMEEVARYTSQFARVALVLCVSVDIIYTTAYYL